LRIAQVTPYFLPVEGGVERHVFNLSKELIGLGHDVDVLTCNLTRRGEVLAQYSAVAGVPVHRFASMASLGEFGKVWPGFGIRLLKGRYDVVHVHAFRHPHTDMSAILSKISSSKSVLTPHSSFYPLHLRRPLARGLVQVYDSLIAPISLRGYDRLVSLTLREARLLRSMGARSDKIALISNGVEDSHFRRGDTEAFKRKYGLQGGEIILYLGRLNRSKGIDVLLDSFEEVAAVRPRARLVLAGPATSDDEESFKGVLIKRAEAMDVRRSIVFTGEISEEEKRAAYDACDVFVLPSIYEGYGLVLLEAGAHAKPVVSTLTDGPSSVVTDGFNGFLVQPANRFQLAEKILRILDDRSLQAEMGERARSAALGHTWHKVAKMTEALYEGIN